MGELDSGEGLLWLEGEAEGEVEGAGEALEAAWAARTVALQMGKVRAAFAEEAGLRVVMLGTGLQRLGFMARSLQDTQIFNTATQGRHSCQIMSK